MPTNMPTHTVDLLVERFEIEWDSESDSEVDAKQSSNKSRHTTILVGKHFSTSGRLVAGHKRAMKARTNAQNNPKGANQVLLSITASPAQCHSSFEELRLECYMQSKIAKDAPPAPVDALAMPWTVIPPFFREFRDDNPQDLGDLGVQSPDEVMAEDF